MKSLSRVRLLATPRTAPYQAPASMGFSRQEYWSGSPLLWEELCSKVSTDLKKKKKVSTDCLKWYEAGARGSPGKGHARGLMEERGRTQKRKHWS